MFISDFLAQKLSLHVSNLRNISFDREFSWVTEPVELVRHKHAQVFEPVQLVSFVQPSQRDNGNAWKQPCDGDVGLHQAH